MMNGNNNTINNNAGGDKEDNRAVHRIRLSAIRHNFGVVEQAAASQKCSVITVVKADAYGHGAQLTARHLADRCGASAFAVATLEEAISIRKEFPLPQHTNIRIMVLGPPVNVPRCFDQYLHHGIEVMVSGMEVAEALWQWSRNVEDIKLSMVESAASQSKEQALADGELKLEGVSQAVAMRSVMLLNNGMDNVVNYAGATKALVDNSKVDRIDDTAKINMEITSRVSDDADAAAGETTVDIVKIVDDDSYVLLKNVGQQHEQMNSVKKPSTLGCSATLSHTSGQHLANEVRNILLQQKTFQKQSVAVAEAESASSLLNSRAISPAVSSNTGSLDGSVPANAVVSTMDAAPVKAVSGVGVSCFKGIEDVARGSRLSQKRGECKDFTEKIPGSGTVCIAQRGVQHRRKLRWHALVDSGMGRLGFKTDFAVEASVDLIRKLFSMEVERNVPIGEYV